MAYVFGLLIDEMMDEVFRGGFGDVDVGTLYKNGEETDSHALYFTRWIFQKLQCLVVTLRRGKRVFRGGWWYRHFFATSHAENRNYWFVLDSVSVRAGGVLT